MFIKTPRLIIQEFKLSDWKNFHAYVKNPEIAKYTYFNPNTEKKAKQFVQRAISSQKSSCRKNFELAIFLKNKKILIGNCGIHIRNRRHREGEIGFLINPHYWGKGYATEVGQSMLEFGFRNLKLHRVFATCDVLNIGSKKVLEKIGMTREGILRQNKWIHDHWRDSFIYSILESDWKNPMAKKQIKTKE